MIYGARYCLCRTLCVVAGFCLITSVTTASKFGVKLSKFGKCAKLYCFYNINIFSFSITKKTSLLHSTDLVLVQPRKRGLHPDITETRTLNHKTGTLKLHLNLCQNTFLIILDIQFQATHVALTVLYTPPSPPTVRCPESHVTSHVTMVLNETLRLTH